MEVSGDVLAPYLLERLSSLVERLGDSKAQVRDAASSLIVDLASVPHSSAALVLEKITPGFMHKQWMVRTGIMQIFMSLLSINQNDLEVQANRLVPTLCKLMSDPNLEINNNSAQVRETAANTIVHLMIVLGEDIGTSIRNRHLMPDSKFILRKSYNRNWNLLKYVLKILIRTGLSVLIRLVYKVIIKYYIIISVYKYIYIYIYIYYIFVFIFIFIF
uniref:TOG domain-containing protein n=1 Tax=Heterorhabditis bacteriophora TaxID=37862 RepID=A0A1I7X6W7_HETBA